MKDDIKEMIGKIKKCLIAGYDIDIINQEELNEYWNYITNLQEENQRLKEENKHIFSKVNDDELLISNAMNYAEAQDYKSRIDKAIEYINNHRRADLVFKLYLTEQEVDKVLNILQGEDNE